MDNRVFDSQLVFLRQNPANKSDLLRFFAEKMVSSAGVGGSEVETLHRALLEREAKGTTAIGGGVAIPHCSLPRVGDFVLAVATVAEGLNYGAFDGQPCRLFFCIIGPESGRNSHVRLLSSLTVGLGKPQAITRLLACDTAAGFITLLLELMEIEQPHLPASAPAAGKEMLAATSAGKSADGEANHLLRVELFCRRERSFRPLLEEVISCSQGAPVVIEANSAGSYLHTMPLFASLWSEEKPNRFMRMIIAVVPRKNFDKLARSVQQLDQKGGGILLLRQALEGCYGSIDY